MVAENNEIFLGSGASLTFVPEVDFYIEPEANGTTVTTVQLDTSNQIHFQLIDNMYVGCTLEFYDGGTYTSSHTVTSNDNDSLTFTPSIPTVTASADYFILKGYGAPCPAPRVSSGTVNVAEVTTVTFLSDDKSDYNTEFLVFTVLASSGGSASTRGVWFDDNGSRSAPTTSATADTEIAIDDAGLITKEEFAAAFTTGINAVSNISATRDGNVVTVTNTYGGTNSAATTTSDASKISVSRHTVGGANTTTTAARRLLSDNWLGLVESATFPNVEVEMKQMNLQLGGTRNFTHQYKGMETASGGNLNLVANHVTWLYYFLGQCTSLSFDGGTNTSNHPSSYHTGTAAHDLYFNGDSATSHINEGPFIYRVDSNNKIIPPIMDLDQTSVHQSGSIAELDSLDDTITATGEFINYTFDEVDTAHLPSFALEQTLSKLESTNTYYTDTDADQEDKNFVRIARGNRVNTLTLTANENEEVKMSMDLNTRAVTEIPQTCPYEARNGVGNNNGSLFNYVTDAGHLEPFFFSDGTISIYGTEFLKITNFTLTMNNNLVDKRFIGVNDRGIKSALPGQRSYEISLTALVTDDTLFTELLSSDENNDTAQSLELTFTKDNGETFNLQFDDYFTTANTWTVPDDKGPITVDATLMPRTLASCTTKTHWILQG